MVQQWNAGQDHMGLFYVMKEAKRDKPDKYLKVMVLGTRGGREHEPIGILLAV